MEQLTKEVISLVKDAGKIISTNLDHKSTVVTKKDVFANFITTIDLQVEKFLTSSLRKITPEFGILSEEGGEEILISTAPLWIIDPLDGTTNFIHKYPSLSISVALIVKNKIEFGVVFNPINNELFHAIKNIGAYLNNNKITVSNNKNLASSIVGFGLPYDRSNAKRVFNAGAKIYSYCQDLKRKGPASLDLAYVACGRLDGFFEVDLELWDYAAGQCILNEAKGKITNWKNEIIHPANKKNDILASNGYIHNELSKNIILF